MKLSSNDKEILKRFGHAEEDFAQIEYALQKSITKYKLGSKPISRDKALDMLGRKVFLSGISRSAFHYTASRETPTGEEVFFDSSRLFK